MKPDDLPLVQDRKAAFPGRMRPGLIEARPCCWPAARPRPFQGACALASLKRRTEPDDSHQAAPFQGACALASLKQPNRLLLAGKESDFPGRMRPGLIEAASSLRRASPAPPFQGACALASLKRAENAAQAADAAHFPGRMRPGLIEAPRSSACSRGSGTAFQGACALCWGQL